MKLYTGFGDKGETALFGGEIVKKNHARVETYGSLDELNSVVGLLRVKNKNQTVDELLNTIQNELFVFGAEVATPSQSRREKFSDQIGKKHISALEQAIDDIAAKSPELKAFVLPGGSEAAAFAHLARTVCRRCERALIKLNDESTVREELIIYLNRLSDLLFAIARYENVLNNTEDIPWTGLRK